MPAKVLLDWLMLRLGLTGGRLAEPNWGPLCGAFVWPQGAKRTPSGYAAHESVRALVISQAINLCLYLNITY